MRVRGYPFAFVIEGDPTAGGPAELSLELSAPFEDNAFDQVRCGVAWYAKLGEYGGFSGTAVSPAETRARLGNSGEPDSRGPQPRWTFDSLQVDPKSLVILGNLILASGLKTTSVLLRTVGGSSDSELAADDFPATFPSVPFTLEEFRVSRNVSLTIDFVHDVDAARGEAIADLLRVWSLVGALGGFRQSGPLLDRYDVQPEDDPEIIFDQITFSFRDQGIHDGGYSVLINLLTRIAMDGSPISIVRIG